MVEDQATPDTDTRAATLVRAADLRDVAEALRIGRDDILRRWHQATSRQPFHQARSNAAVADHIPPLFDALVDLIRREASPPVDTGAPLDDDRVTDEARTHAQMRFEQGLGPVAIVTEFRLLRQEIAFSLAALLDEAAEPRDVVAGMAIVGDALDGATTIGLAALSDKVETLRESFLVTTLHDMRQPITLLNGSLHLAARWLRADEVDVPRIRQSVVDAQIAVDDLVAMVDTLGDASHVAMGALAPEPEPASLAAIVREAVEALGRPARERVDLDAPSGGQLIGLWDPRQIRRLASNLVGNALKYSPNGTRVDVRVSTGSPGWARLVVIDAGLGMTSGEQAVAFERFVRGDRARREGIPGLGLGLYACQGIVTSHGGSISLRSDGPGQGTNVTVELPLMDADELED
ncbi:HAMP domain-containing sensor histidine kinase [soil metagenome]